jgi:hypothetical protein
MKSNQLLTSLILIFGILATGCSEEDIKKTKECTFNGEPVSCESREVLTTEFSGSVKAIVPITMNEDGQSFVVERTTFNLETIGAIKDTDVECPAGLEEGTYEFIIQNRNKLFLKNTSREESEDVATMMVSDTPTDNISNSTWLFTMSFVDEEINAVGKMQSTYNFNNSLTEVEIKSNCVLSPR